MPTVGVLVLRTNKFYGRIAFGDKIDHRPNIQIVIFSGNYQENAEQNGILNKNAEFS